MRENPWIVSSPSGNRGESEVKMVAAESCSYVPFLAATSLAWYDTIQHQQILLHYIICVSSKDPC